MKLAEMTWPEVDGLSRDLVVLIPTGSLEQHGAHLPLFTDSILANSVAEAVESRVPAKILLVPTLWLGASGHHLSFSGTLSASFAAYQGAISSVVESLAPHGFHKFYVLNGHGGNTEPNGIVLRELKAKFSNLTLGHSGYFGFIDSDLEEILEGPLKGMRHACEAETSLMMHLRPELVRRNLLTDDGLVSSPPVKGVIHHFDAITQRGSYGYATFATADKGQKLFNAAVEGVEKELVAIADGYFLEGLPEAAR